MISPPWWDIHFSKLQGTQTAFLIRDGNEEKGIFEPGSINSLVLGDGNNPTFNDGNPYFMGPYKPLRTWVDEFIPYYMEIMGVDRPDRTFGFKKKHLVDLKSPSEIILGGWLLQNLYPLGGTSLFARMRISVLGIFEKPTLQDVEEIKSPGQFPTKSLPTLRIPKDPNQLRGWNLYSRGVLVLKIGTFQRSVYLGH